MNECICIYKITSFIVDLVMDSENFKFANAFKNEGGIYLPFNHTAAENQVISTILTECEYYIASLHAQYPHPNIIFGVIENENLGGQSKKIEQEYYLGITSGAILILHHLFMRMIAHPTILSEYGETSKESILPRMFNIHTTSYHELKKSPGYIPNVSPVDETRKKLAMYLTKEAILLLFCHEYIHIMHGHLDLLNHLRLTNEDILDKPMFRQTLEMDADCVSVSMAFSRNDMLTHTLTYYPELQFRRTFTESISLWHFAVTAFMGLYGNQRPSLEYLYKNSYPVSEIRYFWMGSTVATIVQKYPHIQESIVNALLLSRNHSEKALWEVGQCHRSDSFGKFATEGAAMAHMSRVGKYWNNVRPLLEPFAFKGLPHFNTDSDELTKGYPEG